MGMAATGSKNDLNRLGIFKEMAYISIQDPYVPSSKCTHTLSFHCPRTRLNASLVESQSISTRRPTKASRCCPGPPRTRRPVCRTATSASRSRASSRKRLTATRSAIDVASASSRSRRTLCPNRLSPSKARRSRKIAPSSAF
jgi:hypothetical protein